ncbi:hypothetical protein [Streptomyces tritici]|uniref:hypothetical protein n=1 Tax=Streptomyces tritici TaxID=2054410 RepID=UPI003AF1CC4F
MNILPKSLLVTALGGVVVLGGLGAQHTPADRPSMISVAAASDDDAAEMRFLELADLIYQSCAPDVSGNGDDPAAPSATADGPAVEPVPDSTMPVLVDEVPLTAEEECVAGKHASRIYNAFSGTDTATYEELRAGLANLGYPEARIHRMPDFGGEPVVRLDLRVGADHVALEATGTYRSVMVEAFGAPEGVSVTEVRVERQLDAPTS